MAIVIMVTVADTRTMHMPGVLTSQVLICLRSSLQVLLRFNLAISPVLSLSIQQASTSEPQSSHSSNSKPAPLTSIKRAQVVAQVLPQMLPDAPASGTRKRVHLSAGECARLIAACWLPDLKYRKVPDVNPPGTHMPSASSASVRAAADKGSPPPPYTHQPQSESKVYPFSQCQQVVAPSDQPDGSSNSGPRQTGSVRNSWADMSEHESASVSGSQGKVKRLLSLPSFPLHTRTWSAAVCWEQRAEQARQLLLAALKRLELVQPNELALAILKESWEDILTIVESKCNLLSWVNKFSKRNPIQRVNTSRPVEVSVAASSGGTPSAAPVLSLIVSDSSSRSS